MVGSWGNDKDTDEAYSTDSHHGSVSGVRIIVVEPPPCESSSNTGRGCVSLHAESLRKSIKSIISLFGCG